MKIVAFAAAGLIAAAGLGTTVAADAQTRTVTTRTVTRTHTGPAAHRTHRVCRVTYRYHKKVRTCRTVRY